MGALLLMLYAGLKASMSASLVFRIGEISGRFTCGGAISLLSLRPGLSAWSSLKCSGASILGYGMVTISYLLYRRTLNLLRLVILHIWTGARLVMGEVRVRMRARLSGNVMMESWLRL
ncbi:hypothetical protein F5Y16DRAFT_250305 [Xylariaceae sp. FL0255]|nr:hypothetical protein F5Y16DRAFT_250305 [Xylariaceae sp. FL0255]